MDTQRVNNNQEPLEDIVENAEQKQVNDNVKKFSSAGVAASGAAVAGGVGAMAFYEDGAAPEPVAADQKDSEPAQPEELVLEDVASEQEPETAEVPPVRNEAVKSATNRPAAHSVHAEARVDKSVPVEEPAPVEEPVQIEEASVDLEDAASVPADEEQIVMDMYDAAGASAQPAPVEDAVALENENPEIEFIGDAAEEVEIDDFIEDDEYAEVELQDISVIAGDGDGEPNEDIIFIDDMIDAVDEHDDEYNLLDDSHLDELA